MPRKSPHPHVSWREGRPRFQPDKALREAGHKGRDLRHEDGRWFSRGEAVDWSDAFVRQLQAERLEAATAARRQSGAPPGGQPRSGGAAARAKRVPLYTVARLFEDWFRSPKFILPQNPYELARARAAGNAYSPKTLRDYRQKSRVIESHDPSLWAAPVDALSQEVLLGLYEELAAARGMATARGTILVLSSALGWGRRRGKFTYRSNGGVNPAQDLGMRQSPPRARFASRAEISALMATADRMGWPEMADMIALGVWTGQRQEDRLLMIEKGLINGRRIFKQIKTNAIVSVREAPELEARMNAARERRRLAGIVNPRVILDESCWQPFPDDGDRYRKRFAQLREEAAKLAPSLNGDAEAGILSFHEKDLRATAVTWMAMAGSTIPEIISVTGHQAASATNILKHYLAMHPDMADSALQKMISWYEAESETEFGL